MGETLRQATSASLDPRAKSFNTAHGTTYRECVMYRNDTSSELPVNLVGEPRARLRRVESVVA